MAKYKVGDILRHKDKHLLNLGPDILQIQYIGEEFYYLILLNHKNGREEFYTYSIGGVERYYDIDTEYLRLSSFKVDIKGLLE